MRITAIILAGGKSSRMGQDKGLMFLDEKPMVQYIIDTVKPLVQEIIISSNNKEYEQFGYPVFQDLIKSKGPLAGIYTGLNHSKSDKNIVISCDVPYVSKELINLLIEQSEGSQITIPEKEGKTHQLIGVFSKSCSESFKNAIENNELKAKTVFEKLNLNIVDANQFENKIFTNINTKDDF